MKKKKKKSTNFYSENNSWDVMYHTGNIVNNIPLTLYGEQRNSKHIAVINHNVCK